MADMTVDDLDMDDAPTTPEEWEAATVITDDAILNRNMRWLRATRRRRAAQGAVFQAEIDRLEVLAKAADAPLAEQEDRLMRVIEGYAAEKRATWKRETGILSRATAFGTVKTSETGGGWDKTDETTLVKWARDNAPDLVTDETVTVTKFDLTRAKARFEALPDGTVIVPGKGEIVPGLSAKPKTVKVTVVLDDV